MRCKFIIHYQKEKASTVSSLLKRLNNYSTENNVILQQYILFFNALQESNPITSIELMKKALFLTLPRFDIYKIHLFRLSWLELSIINNIALTYHLTDMPHIGITYFYQLINYFSIADPDSILVPLHSQSWFRLYIVKDVIVKSTSFFPIILTAYCITAFLL